MAGRALNLDPALDAGDDGFDIDRSAIGMMTLFDDSARASRSVETNRTWSAPDATRSAMRDTAGNYASIG
jgi:hypothetical protein